MLSADDAGTARVYGRYNAVGAAAGAIGALAAILPGLGRHSLGAVARPGVRSARPHGHHLVRPALRALSSARKNYVIGPTVLAPCTRATLGYSQLP